MRSRLLPIIVVAAAGVVSFASVQLVGDPAGRAAADEDGPVAILVGASEIAQCNDDTDEATAALLDEVPGTVFTAGDNAQGDGSADEYEECYEASWGRHKERTRPSIGNHDNRTDDGGPYFAYFGEAAGDPDKGYYSYELGAWHIIALNSNCDDDHAFGGCHAGSPQEEWLRADLAASDAQCTLAYWHHPRFGSGRHGGDDDVAEFWEALYEAGAEIVVNGHNHLYERLAPQDPEARPDPERGIRQFTVGTGGAPLYPGEGEEAANLEVIQYDTHGVLKLTLRPDSYEWEFVPVEGGTFTDSGSGRCH